MPRLRCWMPNWCSIYYPAPPVFYTLTDLLLIPKNSLTPTGWFSQRFSIESISQRGSNSFGAGLPLHIREIRRGMRGPDAPNPIYHLLLLLHLPIILPGEQKIDSRHLILCTALSKSISPKICMPTHLFELSLSPKSYIIKCLETINNSSFSVR